MTALVPRNRYLVTAAGRTVGSRAAAAAITLLPVGGGPLLCLLAAVVASVLDAPAILLLCVVGVLAFIAGTIAAWVFLLAGSKDMNSASQMWLAGDNTSPLPLCQRALARVFRGDVRMRAFYMLGLCAEANGDFAEAQDLFRRAYQAIPAMAASKWKRRGQCLMLSHSAIALVAMGRFDEADAAARSASALFLPLPGGPNVLEALADDAAFGAVGVSAALRDLEPGRDPRVLLTLSSAVVLAGRGMAREALELVDRERYSLNAGLFPRERALLENIEGRSRGLLAGGPMRSPGHASSAMSTAFADWAARVLPMQS